MTLAKFMDKPVLFNPLVTLTDTLVEDRGLIEPGSVPARLIALVDQIGLRLADVILVDTDENGRYLVERFRIDEARLVTVPVGADETIFYSDESEDESGRQVLDVLFFGKFIPLHGIETIVRAAGLLRKHQEIRFELVGTGQAYQQMRRLSNELGVTSIRWTDWIPFQELGEPIRAADVVLGIFSGGAKAARVIPNKVYQGLACGTAVVTRDSPAIRECLATGRQALLVPPEDPEELAAALLLLREQRLRERIAAGGLAAYEDCGSRKVRSQGIRTALKKLQLGYQADSHAG